MLAATAHAQIYAPVPVLDSTNRTAVQAWYLANFQATTPPINWTGNFSSGVAGTTSDAFKASILERINAYRALAGVEGNVTLDPTYSEMDQETALAEAVNIVAGGSLTHYPPSSWTLLTPNAVAGASKSCLAQGYSGPDAITAYMNDEGSDNVTVGHRRNLLNMWTQIMGTGDVPQTGNYPAINAVWVGDNQDLYKLPRPSTRDGFVAWPAPGYVPYQLVFARWSLSAANVDFSKATVTVIRNGATVPVTIDFADLGATGEYGLDAIVWHENTAPNLQGADTLTQVTISNVLSGGTAGSWTYSVVSFDPTATNTTSSVKPLAAPPVIVSDLPASMPVVIGQTLTASITALNASSYQWYLNGSPIAGATSSSYTTTISSNTVGNYAVIVSGNGSSVVSTPMNTQVPNTPEPSTVYNPVDTTVEVGGTAVFSGLAVGGNGGAPVTYDWYYYPTLTTPQPPIHFQNNSPTLTLTNVQPSQQGYYQLETTSNNWVAGGATVSLTVVPAGRLVNLSTRAYVGTGSEVLIMGVVISPGQPKPLLIRGMGPALQAFGVSNTLADPSLTIMDSGDNQVGFDVGSQATGIQAAESQVGAFLPAGGTTTPDSATVATLNPGTYTTIVQSNSKTSTGIALAEVYEMSATDSQLKNLSSRITVTPTTPAVAGFVIVNGNSNLLIRAVGPTLAQFGITNALHNLRLDIFNGQTLVYSNTNWNWNGNAQQISSVMAQVGAFSLPLGSTDAALLVDLPAGAYTAVVSSTDGTSGVALVEIYQAPFGENE